MTIRLVGVGHYRNGMVHVSCRVQVGDYGYTFSWRLYWRESTVRRLNRQRSADQRIAFRSKMHLVQEMLRELKPLVPPHYKVYVMFDTGQEGILFRPLGEMRHSCASTFKISGTHMLYPPAEPEDIYLTDLCQSISSKTCSDC